MAKLKHPNVIGVHEVGVHEGQMFVALEFIEGGDAHDWVAANNRSWREIVALYIGAGRGLAAAHAAGLVHRDFKPENILVGLDGRARVGDFGLVRSAVAELDTSENMLEAARERGDSLSPSQSLGITRAGHILGTPAYMAPEQFASAQVDARADQFAFCVSLWESLHGTRPFAGTTATGLMANALTGELRPINKGSKVPAAVTRVLRRGLSAEPGARFETMDALLETLEPLASKRSSRGVVGFVLASACALGVFAYVGSGELAGVESVDCTEAATDLGEVWNADASAALARRFEAAQGPASTQTWSLVRGRLDQLAASWADARTQACEATHVLRTQSPELLERRNECLDRELDELRATVQALDTGDQAVLADAVEVVPVPRSQIACARAERLWNLPTLPRDPEARRRIKDLSARAQRARALLRAANYVEAAQETELLLEGMKDLAYVPLRAELLLVRGLANANLGHYGVARESLSEAYYLARGAHVFDLAIKAGINMVQVTDRDERDPALSRTWAGHTRVLVDEEGGELDQARLLEASASSAFFRGDLKAAQHGLEQVLETYDAQLPREDESRAVARVRLGMVKSRRGDPVAGLRDIQATLDAVVGKLGPAHPLIAKIKDKRGGVLRMLGRSEEAFVSQREAWEIAVAAYPPENRVVAAVTDNLASAYGRIGQHARALELAQRALEIREVVFPADHPSVAISCGNVALELSEFQRYEEAEALHQRALEIYQARFGPRHPSTLRTLNNLSLLYAETGRNQEALAVLENVLAMREVDLGSAHVHTIETRLNVAWSFVDFERHDEAVTYFATGLAQLEELNPNHARIVNATLGLAAAYSKLGSYGEVVVAARRGLRVCERDSVSREFCTPLGLLLGEALYEEGSKAQGRAEVEAAKAGFAVLTPPKPELMARATKWLQTHP